MAVAESAGERWLSTGATAFVAMETAIDCARHDVQLQTYILREGHVARRIFDTLVRALQRGVRVRVLADALGSLTLPDAFWSDFRDAGGEYRLFNPLHVRHLLYRNHRKSLCCDERLAIVGGFNISDEYDGDGVQQGWRDLGMEFHGPLVQALVQSFDNLYSIADFRPPRLPRLRPAQHRRRVAAPPGELLLGGPGQGANPLKKSLMRDLGRARRIELATAYFLPTWGLRRRLTRAARRGAHVSLLLAGPTDVPLARDAARSLYRRLLHAGVQIHEYQPQVLHSKLIIVDDVVYVGSANFNTRSLHIDFELMLRIEDAGLAATGRELFAADLTHAQAMSRQEWKQARGLWQRLRQRFAYFLMARLDPLAAGWLWGRRD